MGKKTKPQMNQMDLARGFAALGGKDHDEDEKLFAFMQIFHPGKIKTMAQARNMRRDKSSRRPKGKSHA